MLIGEYCGDRTRKRTRLAWIMPGGWAPQILCVRVDQWHVVFQDSPLGVRFGDFVTAFPAGINAAASYVSLKVF
jgi:hypothetical protein